MTALVNGNELILTGSVGDCSAWGDLGDSFKPSDVIAALAQVGDNRDVTIRLNSGGGVATDGTAIHAAFARHKGRKTVIVEGIAASAASVIAMAGNDVVMSLGSMLMIHDPAAFVVGTESDLRTQVESLNALGDSMASIYAAKSGRTAADCRAVMRAETWMTADEAVDEGFADRVAGVPRNASPAAFAYAKYRHAPATLRAMAVANGWTIESRNLPAHNAAPPLSADEIRKMVARAQKHHPYLSSDEADALIRMGATESQATSRLITKMAEAVEIERHATAARAMSKDSMRRVLASHGIKT